MSHDDGDVEDVDREEVALLLALILIRGDITTKQNVRIRVTGGVRPGEVVFLRERKR